MSPAQAFGVAVRVVGLVVCAASLLYFISAVIVVLNPGYRANLSPPWHYALSGIVSLTIGWFLLRRADRVVAFAYPEHKRQHSDA